MWTVFLFLLGGLGMEYSGRGQLCSRGAQLPGALPSACGNVHTDGQAGSPPALNSPFLRHFKNLYIHF